MNILEGQYDPLRCQELEPQRWTRHDTRRLGDGQGKQHKIG